MESQQVDVSLRAELRFLKKSPVALALVVVMVATVVLITLATAEERPFGQPFITCTLNALMWAMAGLCAVLGTKMGVVMCFAYSVLGVALLVAGLIAPEGTRMAWWPFFCLANVASSLYLGMYGLKVGRERGFFKARKPQQD